MVTISADVKGIKMLLNLLWILVFMFHSLKRKHSPQSSIARHCTLSMNQHLPQNLKLRLNTQTFCLLFIKENPETIWANVPFSLFLFSYQNNWMDFLVFAWNPSGHLPSVLIYVWLRIKNYVLNNAIKCDWKP